MKKKIISSICVITVLLAFPTFAFGTEAEKLKQAPDLYSKEHVEEIQDLQQNIKNTEEARNPRIGGSKYLSVPLYKQINGDYCGPTSVRMTLKFLGIDKTQSTLAGDMGTNSTGTYVYRMVNGLNKYLGSGKYKYVLTSQIAFSKGLQYSIDKNKPVICHVMTGVLPNYASQGGHNTGHYVVATGYYWGAQGTSGASDVKYNDPNNNSAYYGKWTTTWGKMNTAINNNAGYYIMAS